MSLFVTLDEVMAGEECQAQKPLETPLKLPVAEINKKLLHSHGGTNYVTFGITVDNVSKLAYVSQGIRGIAIVDISDPPNAIQLGSMLFSTGNPPSWNHRGCAVIGKTMAFAVRRSSGRYNSGRIESVDITMPENPVSISLKEYTADFSDIATDGSAWYVSGQREGVYKYTNTNPMIQSQKNETGSWETQGIEVGEVGGTTYVFCSNYMFGVRVLLASDLTDVGLIGMATVTSTGRSLRIWKSRLKRYEDKYYLFCCGNTNSDVPDVSGLAVLDVTDPSNLAWVNNGEVIEITSGIDYIWNPPGGDKPDNDIALYGDYAFIAHGSAGIAAFDISDPMNAKYLGILTNDLDQSNGVGGTQPDSLSALEIAKIGGNVYIISGDGVHNPYTEGTDQIYIDEVKL